MTENKMTKVQLINEIVRLDPNKRPERLWVYRKAELIWIFKKISLRGKK